MILSRLGFNVYILAIFGGSVLAKPLSYKLDGTNRLDARSCIDGNGCKVSNEEQGYLLKRAFSKVSASSADTLVPITDLSNGTVNLDAAESMSCSLMNSPCSNGTQSCNNTNIPRALDEPTDAPFNNNMDTFMTSFFNDHKLNSTVPSDLLANAASGVFGNTDLKIGTDNVYGCTCLIVISRSGVYMTHYYENPTFYDFTPGQQDQQWHQQVFQNVILKSIINGETYGLEGTRMIPSQTAALVPLIRNEVDPPGENPNALFTPDEHVDVLIISPYAAGSDQPLYARREDEIVTVLDHLMPQGTNYLSFNYHKWGDTQEFEQWGAEAHPTSEQKHDRIEDELRNSAQGKVVVEYSPGQGYKVWGFSFPQPLLQDQW